MTASDPQSERTSFFSLSKLKDGLKKYGKTGLYVYLGISFTITTSFYIMLERHVDVKKLLGMKDTPNGSNPVLKLLDDEKDPNKEPSWFESMLIGKGSNLALAIVCGKVLVPVKIPLAIAVTPIVQRWKEQIIRSWALKPPR